MDAIRNSSNLANAKDLAKKKRANRSAKLKQCKRDVRREQFLSQVKDKGGKEKSNGGGEFHVPQIVERNGRGLSIAVLEVAHGKGENDGSMNNYSDSDSSSNSPSSHTGSVVGSNSPSGTNFSGSSSSGRSSRSSCSGGSYSGNVSEEDEDSCLDDWEAVADALAATDVKQEQLKSNVESQEQLKSNVESPPEPKKVTRLDSLPELSSRPALGVNISKPKPQNSQAWRPDDAFRPQSLPNLSKQCSFPMKLDRNHGGTAWVPKHVLSAPSSCPICCEDLDLTDSSFLPCSCGFRLCLFCHKRILEDDGRCPGCRKQYDHDAAKLQVNANLVGGGQALRLARSCSMIPRRS